MRIISFFKTYLVSTAKKYFSLFTDMNLLIWKGKEVQTLTQQIKNNCQPALIHTAESEIFFLKRPCFTLTFGTQSVYFTPQFQSCQSSGTILVLIKLFWIVLYLWVIIFGKKKKKINQKTRYPNENKHFNCKQTVHVTSSGTNFFG